MGFGPDLKEKKKKQQREEGYHSRCPMENNLSVQWEGKDRKRKRRIASPFSGCAESEGRGVGVQAAGLRINLASFCLH